MAICCAHSRRIPCPWSVPGLIVDALWMVGRRTPVVASRVRYETASLAAMASASAVVGRPSGRVAGRAVTVVLGKGGRVLSRNASTFLGQ